MPLVGDALRAVRGLVSNPAARRAIVRSAGLCLGTAIAAGVLGGGAFWLCVPVALLLAAPVADKRVAALAAALPTLAAAAPALAGDTAEHVPSLVLIVLVVGGSVAVVRGVRNGTEAEREALRESALTDPLTGAANRRALGERIEYEIARHTRARRTFAVLALDLDGFKLVNDRFGHAAGDEILCDVADALHDAVREQDTVARLGGDEFCVLAPETDGAGAEHLAARVDAAVQAATAGLDTLSASIGISMFPSDGLDARSVLEAADSAQIHDKRRRRRNGAAMRPAA